jgi:putative phage-type endonuclease
MKNLDRKTYMGSSDAAPACGVSPYATPLDVYLAKRGEPTEIDTFPIRFGNHNESLVLDEFTRETGRQVSSCQEHFRHPEFTFIGATVDGISDGAVVEAKTTSVGFDTLPDHIEVQVQEQLACAGLQLAFVPVLMRGRDFKIFEVKADADLQEMILERMARLWLRVQEGDPPPAMSPGDLKRLFPQDKGSEMVADPTLVKAAKKLRQVKAAIATLSDQKAVLEAAIQGEMGEHAVLTDIEGWVLATWKNTKPSKRFDNKAFKAAMPEVYEEFVTTTNGSRRFVLKGEKP